MGNALEEMEYPGRGLGIGATKLGEIFVAYFITGRSNSSKNRKIEREGAKVYTEPILPDPTMDPEIYFYDAMLWHGGVVAVSNGRQTNQTFTDPLCGNRSLDQTMADWNYEPDKLHTPRIFGRVIIPPGEYRDAKATIGIVRPGEENPVTKVPETVRKSWPVELEPGAVIVLTTYQGDSKDVRPSVVYLPEIKVESTSVDALCAEFGSMLDHEIAVCSAALLVKKSGDIHFDRMNYQGI